MIRICCITHKSILLFCAFYVIKPLKILIVSLFAYLFLTIGFCSGGQAEEGESVHSRTVLPVDVCSDRLSGVQDSFSNFAEAPDNF